LIKYIVKIRECAFMRRGINMREQVCRKREHFLRKNQYYLVDSGTIGDQTGHGIKPIKTLPTSALCLATTTLSGH
jgi:hypothetical protein